MQLVSSKVIQMAGAFCLALSLFSVVSHAEEVKGKVAVLDLERAIMMTDMAREKIKTLESQKDYADMQKKIETLQKDRDKKIADAQKEGPTWTPEQQSNYQKDMDFILKDLQLSGQKVQAENEDLERGIMKDMEPKFKDAINQIITEEKISILLRREAVFTATPDSDITSELTDKLNKQK